jgi:hypothetical protein
MMRNEKAFFFFLLPPSNLSPPNQLSIFTHVVVDWRQTRSAGVQPALDGGVAPLLLRGAGGGEGRAPLSLRRRRRFQSLNVNGFGLEWVLGVLKRSSSDEENTDDVYRGGRARKESERGRMREEMEKRKTAAPSPSSSLSS